MISCYAWEQRAKAIQTILVFIQGITNNVVFTNNVGDTTQVSLQLILSKTNIFGDTKDNT